MYFFVYTEKKHNFFEIVDQFSNTSNFRLQWDFLMKIFSTITSTIEFLVPPENPKIRVPNSKANKYPKNKFGFFCDLFEFSSLQPLATIKGKDRQLQLEKIPGFTFLNFGIDFQKSMNFDFFFFAGVICRTLSS